MNARIVTAESRRGLNPAAAVVTGALSAPGCACEPGRGLCCRCRRHS